MENSARVEAEYQLQFSEFYRALRWYAWRKYWWHYCILCGSVPAGAFATHHFTKTELPGISFALILVAVIPIVLLLGVYMYWELYRKAKRQFRTSGTLSEVRRTVISHEGLESSSARSSGKLAWAVFYEVIETPESFLFFTSNTVFILLPKRIFSSEEQIHSLRALVAQNVGSKVRLRGM